MSKSVVVKIPIEFQVRDCCDREHNKAYGKIASLQKKETEIMLAPQEKRRRVARLVVISSDSEDDVKNTKHTKSDDENYEPSPLKKIKWVQIVALFVVLDILFVQLFAEFPKKRSRLKRRHQQEPEENYQKLR